MSGVGENDIKDRAYYFFEDMFNNKNLDTNNIKIVQKSYKNITYYIGYVTPNCVKPLCLTVNK